MYREIAIHALEVGFKSIVASVKNGNIFGNVATLLKVLPCIHFLRNNSKPNQKLTKFYSWGDRTLNIGHIRTAMIKQTGYVLNRYNLFSDRIYLYDDRFVRSILDDIRPLLKLDPLLEPTLLYICPKEELPFLCDHVQLNLLIAIVVYNLNQIPQYEDEVLNIMNYSYSKFTYQFLL